MGQPRPEFRALPSDILEVLVDAATDHEQRAEVDTMFEVAATSIVVA